MRTTAQHEMNRTDADGIYTYTVGQAVEVHAMGSWYFGHVDKITAFKVTVRYVSGSGSTRSKTVPVQLVRHHTIAKGEVSK